MAELKLTLLPYQSLEEMPSWQLFSDSHKVSFEIIEGILPIEIVKSVGYNTMTIYIIFSYPIWSSG